MVVTYLKIFYGFSWHLNVVGSSKLSHELNRDAYRLIRILANIKSKKKKLKLLSYSMRCKKESVPIEIIKLYLITQFYPSLQTYIYIV